MRRPCALLAAFLVLAGAAAAHAADDTCVGCHRGLEGRLAEPPRLMPSDIHGQHGMACTSCHGGDGTANDKDAAHDRAKGFVGPPKGKALLDTCGRCHSDPVYMKDFNPAIRVDQVAQYVTSHHGKKLLEGDQKVATCVSCHGAHGIIPPKDPASPVFPANVPATCGKCHGDAKYMEGRKIPTDVLDNYREGVHGQALLERGDLAAPACNACHGNHGAAPPEITSVANVCGTCHVQQATLFRTTRKKRFFDTGGVPECVVCHGHHDIRQPADSMLSLAPDSACVQCHGDEEDPARKATQELAQAFTDFDEKLRKAESVLSRAERAGMEVSEPIFKLSEARDHLTEARVIVHSFDKKRVIEKILAGRAIAVAQEGEGAKALDEVDFRRRGLYVSLVAIALLALGLWLKIRDLDRREPTPSPNR